MTTVNKAATIAASPDHILRILLDVEDWPSWQPVVDKVDVLERDPQGRPKQSRIRSTSDDQETICTLLYDYSEQYRFEYFLVEGTGITSHDASYAIVGNADGTSEVTINMRLEVDWPLPPEELDPMIDGAIQMLVDALKVKAEQPV
jgi:ribosome-associated toxin RatA of RatAB toxin-antitoxin module